MSLTHYEFQELDSGAVAIAINNKPVCILVDRRLQNINTPLIAQQLYQWCERHGYPAESMHLTRDELSHLVNRKEVHNE